MYIRKIEIKNFRGNDFSWSLNTDVNILISQQIFTNRICQVTAQNS
jgi:hypothetical protein